ncbi:unnamed protein product [marine sediment metagenome]|uniref:Uncharacterized protein n=1 Tax=marine sediment metagenome TaxID=412755 RepID=X1GL09_9ZZZZ
MTQYTFIINGREITIYWLGQSHRWEIEGVKLPYSISGTTCKNDVVTKRQGDIIIGLLNAVQTKTKNV